MWPASPADTTDELSGAADDATVVFRAVGPLADAGEDLSDATVPFRAVGRRPAAGEDLSDATVVVPGGRPAGCCG